MEPKKYEYIDSLRGIAVIFVVGVHVTLMNPSLWDFFPEFMQLTMQHWIHCIQLFFIVSAFTLTISYHNRINEPHATRNFIIRRFFRIAPMYYLAIIYFTFAIFLGFNLSQINWADLPVKGLISSFLFMNGLFPAWINSYVPGGWTITVEFMFYFTMPIICRYINNLNKSIVFVLATLLFSTLLNTLLAGSSFDKFDFLYYYFPNQLPIFAMGILAYWLINESIYNIKTSTALFLTTVFAFYCFISFPLHFVDTIVFLLLILILNKKPYKLFSNKILAIIGKYSFSLYLIHFAILKILAEKKIDKIFEATNSFTAILDAGSLYLLVLGGAFIISHFTYKYVEVPGQNLGRKLIKRLNTKPL
ncbi:MAG: acyltransferase family protein [Dysgonomonas sp.]